MIVLILKTGTGYKWQIQKCNLWEYAIKYISALWQGTLIMQQNA